MKIALRLIEPPPLHPQTPTRLGSRYGRCFRTAFTAAACSCGARMPTLRIDRLPPGPAPGRGRAAVVEAHHHVALLGEHPVPELVAAAPAVERPSGRPARRRRGRAADTSPSGRSAAAACTSRRASRPSPMSTRKNSVFTGSSSASFFLSAALSVKQLDPLVARQADQLDERRRVGGRIVVDGPPAVGRDLVIVRARLILGRHPLAALAVEADAVEVLLRRVLGRGREVDRGRTSGRSPRSGSRRNRPEVIERRACCRRGRPGRCAASRRAR